VFWEIVIGVFGPVGMATTVLLGAGVGVAVAPVEPDPDPALGLWPGAGEAGEPEEPQPARDRVSRAAAVAPARLFAISDLLGRMEGLSVVVDRVSA
jgi:hypothetical protein